MRHLNKILTHLLSLALVSFRTTCWAKFLREVIIRNALADGIDLESLSFSESAFAEIEGIKYSKKDYKDLKFTNESRVDVHVHVVPSFYRNFNLSLPVPTPDWDVASHLQMMANNSISHSLVSMSTPGSNVFIGNETATAGLARLLNEFMAEFARNYPDKISFYATMPLPYTDAAIKEAEYALTKLKARGLGLMTNHEGIYAGENSITPFFSAVNAITGGPHAIFFHPTFPKLRLNGSLIDATPGPTFTLPYGDYGEFYFETARTVMGLTISQTLRNFTNIHYGISHCGGAFPTVIDRVLRNGPDAFVTEAVEIYKTRMWYDSAGPTYPRQVQGLLNYVPKSQLLYGSDWPFNPIFEKSVDGVEDDTLLTQSDKEDIYHNNIRAYLTGAP